MVEAGWKGLGLGEIKWMGTFYADKLIISGDAIFDTNTLFVDSINNRVGIGTESPDFQLELETTAGPVISLKNTGTTNSRIIVDTKRRLSFCLFDIYFSFCFSFSDNAEDCWANDAIIRFTAKLVTAE